MDTVKRVYELAQEHNVSLYLLSQKSGVSYSTIKTTEKRGGQLKIDTIERICRALGITLSDFFAGQDSIYFGKSVVCVVAEKEVI